METLDGEAESLAFSGFIPNALQSIERRQATRICAQLASLVPARGRPQGASLHIDANGDLVVHGEGSEVIFHKPVAYQRTQGQRMGVNSRYVLKGDRQVTFEVASYDRTKPLIIDPVLRYSTYLGGSGDEFNHGTAIDSRRNIYLAGPTSSNDFPTLNAAQPQFGGGTWDAFLAKISPDNPSANASGPALSQPSKGSGAEKPRPSRTMPDWRRKIDMTRKLAH